MFVHVESVEVNISLPGYAQWLVEKEQQDAARFMKKKRPDYSRRSDGLLKESPAGVSQLLPDAVTVKHCCFPASDGTAFFHHCTSVG